MRGTEDMIVHAVWHFYGFTLGEVLNAERHHGKYIGIFACEAEAQRAIRQVADQPGFRDHPEGFRLFSFEVDRTYWSAGFRPGPDGDEAIADDSSGIFGTDDAMADNANDDDRNFEREELVIASKPFPESPDDLWELSHYKISRENGQNFEDMGYKFVGYYSTRAKLDQAIGHLRTRPGFSEYPDGFRILWDRIGTVHWSEGFA